MKISILTLFPEMFQGPFQHSIIKRAQEKKYVAIEYVNIRDFGIGKHQMVDDRPYGGGIGMVMRVDVVHAAIAQVKHSFLQEQSNAKTVKQAVILLSAGGKKFTQTFAQTYSEVDHLILICGHYEGIDERIKTYIDDEISIGDFVVTGGEIPAMLLVDAVTRLIPGVLKEGATSHESFSLTKDDARLLEYPQFTQPPEYDGQTVPDVLLSGNHAKINAWRQEEAIKKTEHIRPDLLKK